MVLRPHFLAPFIISLLVWASATCSASTARPRTFLVARAPKPAAIPALTNKSLEIRGGSLVKTTSVAKGATIVSLIQGAVAWFDPKSALKGYGISTSPVAEIIMRRLGIVLIQMGIVGVCLFFLNCSLETTLGTASIGWVVEIMRSFINNEHETIGFGLGPQLAILLQCSVVAYLNLSNQEYAPAVNKANAAFVALSALTFALVPKWVLEVSWGMKIDDAKVIGMVSGFGYWFVAYAIYIAGLAWDMKAIRALTWSRLFILLIHFLPSRGESIGMNKSKQNVLLAYQAFVFAGLVLQDGLPWVVAPAE